MLANLMFRRGETPQAVFYFKNVFEKKPDHYEALITLTKLLYRAGNIDQMQSFIDNIEKKIPRATNEAGFNFAKGLFYQLSCKPIEALKFYNKCRGDKKYGALACIEMTNVCLNPDNEIRSDEDWKKKSANQKSDSAKTTQETAVFLLKGAASMSNDVRYKIMENYCLIHTGEKNNLEKAIENLYNLESKFVISLIALLSAFLIIYNFLNSRKIMWV
jgi:tetratricopeptide repeat protein 21B